MPLYLVRRGSTLTVSLIRASSEEQLMDIIDEVDTPSRCTWSVYSGPLMIDLTIPVKYKAKPDVTGRVRPKSAKLERPSDSDAFCIAVSEPDACETVGEMKRAIVTQAFPVLAEPFYDHEGDAPDLDELCRALAEDVDFQSRKLQRVSVTFGDDGRLRRVRLRVFRLVLPHTFERIPVSKANDFCAGRRRLTPDREDLVHLAFVYVEYVSKQPVSATYRGLRLRVDATGRIIRAHRAGAFGEDAGAGPVTRMQLHRNEAVQWDLSPAEYEALTNAVDRWAGGIHLTARSD